MHFKARHIFLVLFVSMLTGSFHSFGQLLNLTRIKGLPSSEAYKVLVDRKGYVWVGHNLGLSRYDGHNFTNFPNPEQTSLSISGLLEDEQGRIWCHNFSGQFFYVENEKLHVLKSYDNVAEHNFGQMVKLKNHLIATTDKGLFLYKIKTRKHRYLKCINNQSRACSTSSITTLNNNAIAFGDAEWFKCDTNGKVTNLSKHKSAAIVNNGSCSVQPFTLHDTIYVVSNLSGCIYKMLIKADVVYLVNTIKVKTFINTLSLVNGQVWINTKKESINMFTGQHIKDFDLSDIQQSALGNTWYSSLKYGLLIKSKAAQWQYAPNQIANGDAVRSMAQINNLALNGTENGQLILKDNNTQQTIFTQALPANAGAVEVIKPFANFFLVGASRGIFLFDVHSYKLKLLFPTLILKDATASQGNAYFAVSNNLLTIPLAQLQSKQLSPLQFSSNLQNPQRCRAVVYNSHHKSIYAAVKNGLFKITDTENTPVLFNGKPIYASTLVERRGNVLAGTYSQGLLLIKPTGIIDFDAQAGLLVNTVLKIKLFNNRAWIIGDNCIQLFDMDKEKFIEKIDLPLSSVTEAYDLWEQGDKLFITTSNGLHVIKYNASVSKFSIKNYLLYTLINNRDTLFGHSATLPYNHNNISFNLSSICYNNAEDVSFKYKLTGSNNDKWQYLPTGIKTVQYASLMPGKYTFEALAQHSLGKLTNPHIIFNLTIQKPWWQQLWFILIAVSLLILLVVTVIVVYYKIVIDRQRLTYEKRLAIELERKTISRDLHDNVGQILSFVKLTLGTIAGQTEQDKQSRIDESRNLLSQAISDLRNISKNLSFQTVSHLGLTKIIEAEIDRINKSGLIEIEMTISGEITNLGEQRELILFRIFQETLNNTLKHADASLFKIHLQFKAESFNLTLADDGLGFVVADQLSIGSGSGLKNIESRAAQIGAIATITSSPGNGCTIGIILNHLTPHNNVNASPGYTDRIS